MKMNGIRVRSVTLLPVTIPCSVVWAVIPIRAPIKTTRVYQDINIPVRPAITATRMAMINPFLEGNSMFSDEENPLFRIPLFSDPRSGTWAEWGGARCRVVFFSVECLCQVFFH